MKLSKNAIQWLASGDRGVSSNTIFETITGINTGEKHQDYPHDPADFRECLRLLDACTEFKPMLGKMKDISPIWSSLVDRWDEIQKVFESEVPNWREYGWHATSKTYNLMREIIEGAVSGLSCKIKENNKLKTAILIIGYNRPDLFKKVVTSVKNNNSDYPKYISLDNCGDDSIIKKHIDICRENFPTFSFELRNKRVRQDIHIFQSLKTVFDMGYDRVIYLEDDTLISDNGIKLLDNILNWTDSYLKNVGMAQLWSNRVFTDDDIIRDENVLAYTGENLWGAIIKKECWFSCLHVIEKYMEELDYNDFTKIRAMLANMDVNIQGIPEFYKEELMKDSVLGWDGFFHKLYMSKGWRRVSTMIPRCINIGKDGENSCEEAWNVLGYGKIKLYQDVNIPTEFKFINEEY